MEGRLEDHYLEETLLQFRKLKESKPTKPWPRPQAMISLPRSIRKATASP